jgi:hypothetical protein
MRVRTEGSTSRPAPRSSRLTGPRAPRGARRRLLESASGHRPRHAVVANDLRRVDRRYALARRLLSGLRNEPSDRSAHHRSPPARLGRHFRARAALFLVSGVGADAETALPLRRTASGCRPCHLRGLIEERKAMANVYVEARPKGRIDGSPITAYVVEDHADHVLATFKTQHDTPPSGRKAKAKRR